MKKKFGLAIMLCMMIAAVCALFTACGEDAVVSAPGNLQYDGSSITWGAVNGASYYTVRINDGEENKVTVPSYPYDARDQQFNVSVRAVSDVTELIRSDETVKTFRALGNVGEVTVADDGAISWDPVENPEAQYLIRVDGNVAATVTTPSYSELPEGRHSVQVRATHPADDSYYSKWTSAKEINILATVSRDDIVYENGKIKWKYVPGAARYELSIDGRVVASDCTVTEWVYEANRTDFEVNVRALGDHSSAYDGRQSETKKFIFLATVSDISVADGIVAWSEIANADGYFIELNGMVQDKVLRAPQYTDLAANTTVRVRVMPMSDSSTYFSDWSAELSVYLIASPILQWNREYDLTDGQARNNLYWDNVPQAASYTVRLTHPDGRTELFPGGSNGVDFSYAYPEVGTYRVEVKSNANTTDGTTYDSKYSVPVIVKRLPAPERLDSRFIVSDPSDLSQGFTINFSHVQGASEYRLERDHVDAVVSTSNQFRVGGIVDGSVTEEQHFNYKISSVGKIEGGTGNWQITLGSLDSSALAFEITVLSTPRSPEMDGFTYSYSGVAGSNGYAVSDGSAIYTSQTTEYSLEKLGAGTYTVSVCARGNGAEVLASNYSSPLTVQRLEAPSNIHIETSEASEGLLAFEQAQNAHGAYIVFDDNGEALPVSEVGNLNARITEQGTTVFMYSSANYYNERRTIYYMTSQRSATVTFIKLSAPTFGDAAFTNDQFIWRAPSNINTYEYTPTYEVYMNGLHQNGEMNGTSMNISHLAGGDDYSFYVKAIGNGTKYINSGYSVTKAIHKLGQPTVTREEGKYTWKAVENALSYVVWVDGVLKETYKHEAGKTYSFVPQFDELKVYQVEVWAVGDGGYTTIDSPHATIEQETKQLTTPTFTFHYNGDYFTPEGTVEVTVQKAVPYALGYLFTVGGVRSQEVIKSLTYTSQALGTAGSFKIYVSAVGGGFDEQGIYYIDSQTAGGGSSSTLTVLAAPNADEIKLNQDGVISWPAISGTGTYTIELCVDGVWQDPITVQRSSYKIDSSQYAGKTLRVRIRAIGNGKEIVSSAAVEHEWNIR